MPSPFPGMDPYIEGNFQWHTFHNAMIIRMIDALNDDLPEGYVATNEVRMLSVDEEGASQREPDVSLVDEATPRPGRGSNSGGGALATLEPHTMLVPEPLLDEASENYVEILRLRDRKVVTTIELLSLSNKVGNGREDYLRRRRVLMASGINFVELDLMVGGRRLPMQQPLPAGDFYAFVTRRDRYPESAVYAWTLRDPLPTLPVPLREFDGDVPLDLAAVFRTTYDRGRYPLLLSYGEPLGRPFDDADRAWAADLLVGSVA